MLKKFIIRDEDEKEYEVEEVAEEKEVADEEPAANGLTDVELDSLKRLASVADKLIALIDIEKDEHQGEAEAEMLDEEEEIEEADEDEKDDDEIIVDTDEDIKKMLKTDSKKAFGSIAKQTNKNSIADAHQLDVDSAWAKRYGGIK